MHQAFSPPRENRAHESTTRISATAEYGYVVTEVVELAIAIRMSPSSASFEREEAISTDDSSASSRARARAQNFSVSSRGWRGRGSDFVVRSWRDLPREKTDILLLLRRNFIVFLLVLVAGIATWELSVDQLRDAMNLSGIFPVYLPHAVALAFASVWAIGVAPGTLFGLYGARMYMVWRGPGFTSLNTTVLFLVAFLATIQSHVVAYYLRQCLCAPATGKRIPTIDSVADAVWYLLIVTLCTLVSCFVIAVCITITPLVSWSVFWRFWGTWWLSVLSAMITVTPLITHSWAWTCKPSLKRPGKVLECILTALVTLGMLILIFFFNLKTFRTLPYLCFPLVTFTSFRFNRVGWAATVSAIALASALGTIRERGTIYSMSEHPRVGSTALILQVEVFSIVMGVVSITLAAAVREKKNLTRTLHLMNVELENKVDRRTVELQKANQELQISQSKAEMASHAKTDFLANMSHEIRTPIHGILGLTALLLESELSVDQKESLVSMKECADLLLHIINSVLDLAKIEAGRLEVELVPFNVRKMVSSTFRMMQARARERGLKVFWEVDRGVPLSLIGDIGKLQQCLLNLVGNALKFTHEGSISVHIGVASDYLKASMTRAGDCFDGKTSSTLVDIDAADKAAVAESMLIHFEVRDTGIGINQEKLKDMFKPFTQADASTSRLYGGTGLGLCIVHRFVELLGGTIWVESELGKGSAFHFCLPLFLNTFPKEVDSAETPPKLRSPEVTSKSRSLRGGLVLSHSGAGLDAGPESRSSNKLSRESSANNKVEATAGGADSTVISIEDSGMLREMASKRRDTLIVFAHEADRIRRARRASASDYEAYKEAQKILKNHPDYLHTRARNSQVLHGDSDRDGDRGASNEVITRGVPPLPSSAIPVKPDVTAGLLAPLPPIRTAMARPPLSAGFQAERPGMATRAQDSSGRIPSPPSSVLSRESSTELEKMLVAKLQLKILLAEDNAINQKVASRQLEKHGHRVTVVGDGQQALDSICANHDSFDLVLMDVQMPIMDGLIATEQIRKAEMEKGWSRVPILGLTAHAIQGYQDTCLIHGMDGYLGKPFDIQQLLKTIGHILPADKLNRQE